MAWIETRREDEWEGPLAALLDMVVDRSHGRVDNIMQVHSIDPAALEAHHAVYQSAMRGTPTLRKVDRELIALVVSAANRCRY